MKNRVGAIKCSENNVIEFYGYGVYVGEEVPTEDVYFMGLQYTRAFPGKKNPKILLDNGKTIYGCECWWGDEEKVKEILKGKKVKNVDIEKDRKKNLEQMTN